MLPSELPCANQLEGVWRCVARLLDEADFRLRPSLRAFRTAHPELAAVARRVKERSLSYLSLRALIDLAEAALAAEAAAIPGVIVEAGCGPGGSAILLAASKARSRQLRVYDLFGTGFAEPGARDGDAARERAQLMRGRRLRGLGGNPHYSAHPDLKGAVLRALGEFGLNPAASEIRLIDGRFDETLVLDGQTVALAHIDCDWHDSVRCALERIEPCLAVGGRIVIDDYFSWPGCRAAVDEYFSGPRRSRYRYCRQARLHLVRTE